MNKFVRIFALALVLAVLIGGVHVSNSYAQLPNPTPSTPAVSTDLRLLPRPIYEPNLNLSGAAALILPDAPSADEMRAALIVAAGFGRMSNGKLALAFLTASQFSAAGARGYDLIFVGKPADFAMLAQARLPAPVVNTSYSLAEMQPDDGLLQMIVSPWDAAHVILVVGGNSDAGVVKAAQAVSAAKVQTGADPRLAIVAGVRAGSSTSGSAPTPPSTDRTFSNLGYERKFVFGRHSEVDFYFDVPPGYLAREEPYLDLVFGNTTLLDASSSLEIYLNGHYITSSRFSIGTINTSTLRCNIRTGFVVTGINTITIVANLTPYAGAEAGVTPGAVIEPESLLHIPISPITIAPAALQNLATYPYPYINDPALSNVAFILPQNDMTAWEVAVQVAFDLGMSASKPPFDLSIAYDGQIPDELRKEHDWIVIGLPTELTIITELRDTLPAPFAEGSNIAILTKLPVEYRLPAGVELGYLELLPAPWSRARTILAVLGNETGGVYHAGVALTTTAQRSKITGDFTLINDETLSSTDTRSGAVVESVATATVPTRTPTSSAPINNGAPTPQVPTTATARDWLPVIVIGLLVLMVVILFVGVLSNINRKKLSR
jgi:hypothetical protein